MGTGLAAAGVIPWGPSFLSVVGAGLGPAVRVEGMAGVVVDETGCFVQISGPLRCPFHRRSTTF